MRKGKVEKLARGREKPTAHLPPSAPTRLAHSQAPVFLLGKQIHRRESDWAALGSGDQSGPISHGVGGVT